jgi:hypothetical protein
MNQYTWKILDITAENNLIINARYSIKATDDINTVETENNYSFVGKEIKILYDQVLEQDIINWIKDELQEESILLITSQLDNQLNNLKINQTIGLPWLANTFTLNIDAPIAQPEVLDIQITEPTV